MHKKILALDTSSPLLVLAFSEGPRVKWRSTEAGQWKHIETILPRIDLGLNRCGWTLDEIDVIACGIGPGSFTGLRVGIAVVKALSLAKQKKIVAVSSFESIAAGFSEDGDLGVMLDARRGKIYYAQFKIRAERRFERSGACVLSVRQLIARFKRRHSPITVSGDGIAAYGQQFKRECPQKCVYAPETLWSPQADPVIACACEKIKKSEFVKVPALLPSYMCLSAAEEAQKKRKR